MKQLTTTLLLLCLSFSFAQKKAEVSDEIVSAIKKDVWIPFMESYNELNSNKLMSIHSRDIVRVTIDDNQIKSGETYLEYYGKFLNIVKDKGGKVAIAFAIASTAIDESEEIAYQTGYYRFSTLSKDGEEMVVRGYGYFNVGLKLEDDNVWRIWLDSDKKAEITDSEFNAHKTVYEIINGPS